jgi:Flp pilus assembly protein TadG
MSGRRRERRQDGRAAGAPTGQALVEAAIWTPLLLVLLCGMWGFFILLRAYVGLEATVHEAARAGALASSEVSAHAGGSARGRAVAADYGLGPAQQLTIVVTLPDGFGRGAIVQAEARARVRLRDVPFFGWVEAPLVSRHRERIDRWRTMRPSP